MRPAAVACTSSITLSPSRSTMCGGGSPPPSMSPSPLASIAIGQPGCLVGSWCTKKTLRSSPRLQGGAGGVVRQLGSSSSRTRRRTVKANWFEGTFACPCTTGPEGGAEKSVPGGKAAMTSARFRFVRSAPGRRGGEVPSSKPTWLGLEPIANCVKLVGSVRIPGTQGVARQDVLGGEGEDLLHFVGRERRPPLLPVGHQEAGGARGLAGAFGAGHALHVDVRMAAVLREVRIAEPGSDRRRERDLREGRPVHVRAGPLGIRDGALHEDRVVEVGRRVVVCGVQVGGHVHLR